MPRINWLAESHWWEDETTLRLKLREGVLFHDGTPFNSTAAKWNLERINYLTNVTGTLPKPMEPAGPSDLWKFPNGTGIMKQIDIVNDYNITIHLKSPYSPFLDLLCFSGAYMISPISHSQTDYIDLDTGDLIGTGPFEYDGYNASVEVEFHAFNNYWQGVANITEMKFSIISNPTDLNNAMVNGDIDFLYNPLTSYYSTFAADPDIIITEAPTPGLNYWYLGMNNNLINITWRKAISYAVNYSYIIQEMMNNYADRAYSPISPGLIDGYYNCSDIAPYYNVTIARQTLIDAGVTTLAVDDDAGWQAATLATFNFSRWTGNAFRETLYPLLSDWLDKIGITLIEVVTTVQEFYTKLNEKKNRLSLYWMGWISDYKDSYNTLGPLMYSTSSYNSAQVNDSWIDTKLEEALETTDDSARNTIYHDIQINVSSYLYPYVSVFHKRIFFVYNINLTNYPHNSFERLYFYPCEWIPTYTYVPEPPPIYGAIFIDDSDPNYNWSKTALENDWCNGSGTWNDPFIIQDLIIDGENTASCIEIYNSSVYFEIRNCTLYNGAPHGINIINTDNSFIYNNTLYDEWIAGIFLENSDNHTIYENKMWSITNGYGIILMMDSDHCKVLNNSIKTSIFGITTVLNFDNLIIDNIVTNNTIGIGVASYNTTVEQNDVLDNTMVGIMLQNANETIIKNNLVSDGLYYGIYVMGTTTHGSHNNTIIDNRIYNNVILGLGFDNTTSQNEVFFNEFIGNLMNGEDNGTLNRWDNGVIGNSWDDYIGFDTDDNGIGDSPYLINGTAGSVDNYPIYDDGPETAPTIIITLPSDNQGFSDTAPIFSLTIIAPEYDSIWYTLDNGITNITCGTFDQVNTSLWEGLGDNTYTLRFYANSSAGPIGTAAISIYKDTLDPVININDPDPGDEFTTTIPVYDITITEDHLASYWYTMEGGTPIPITVSMGSIDEDEWNALPNGQVNITFYAIDTVGNIGFSYVIINKNAPTAPPDIPGPYPILILMILLAGIIGLTWRQKQKLK